MAIVRFFHSKNSKRRKALKEALEEPMDFGNPTEDSAQTKEIQLPDSRRNGKGIDP